MFSFQLNKKGVSFCIPECFNTNISHQLFDCIITFLNSQHWNTKLKWFCIQNPVLNVRFKDISCIQKLIGVRFGMTNSINK